MRSRGNCQILRRPGRLGGDQQEGPHVPKHRPRQRQQHRAIDDYCAQPGSTVFRASLALECRAWAAMMAMSAITSPIPSRHGEEVRPSADWPGAFRCRPTPRPRRSSHHLARACRGAPRNYIVPGSPSRSRVAGRRRCPSSTRVAPSTRISVNHRRRRGHPPAWPPQGRCADRSDRGTAPHQARHRRVGV